MGKKLAVHLFGALRTYSQTYESFFSNIIDVNKQDGWEIDIFLHTWDQFDTGSAHSHIKYPGLTGVKIGIHDIENIIGIYQPKQYLIEPPILDATKSGMYITLEKVNSLKLDYEQKHNIKYNYHLYTRPDIMFFKPLKIDEYIKVYNSIRNPRNGWEGVFKEFPLMPKTNFCSSNAFRFGLLDSRMPNEGDLIWFSNFSSVKHPHRAYLEDKNIFNIFIKYRWEYEFRPWRSGMKYINQYMFVDIRKSDLDNLNHQILNLNQEKLSLQESLDSIPTKKSNMELICLEQDIEIKKLQLYQLQKKAGISNLLNKNNIIYPNSAKFIVCNHLSYKFGSALIKYNSFIGYIKLPFILWAIFIAHKTINFKEKVFPLKTYPDYNEAQKEKDSFTYKLGQMFIKACKNWYKGGLIKFIFEVNRLTEDMRCKK
ncbi:hypothetical protein LNU06_06890 [Campylobacter sp. VicNov18]|uniref:alpha-2,3-sialyltransferase n=1 Tax=Campylobacter bilis TaxID=2691918 RepID=UPI00130DD5F9|nr:alpha-2,3-sialyltransferase [Campylobacter bilis]MPV64170.1 alpha-2,3-sialyltransferase [Campylobacter hepaticus]MBM0637674.1 alpha-2,3-sialyltransferase [Campylobacter bilis]MCC8278398.1 hypothetical protein [Campylobacter bilis]MCC8299902.1 hypothetical protein [Campylobacter bilis]MCC8301307.1 hypothetical protein [Campylobacter bilis]